MLHVDDPAMAAAASESVLDFDAAATDEWKADLAMDGVFSVPPSDLNWHPSIDFAALATAATILHDEGWPPHAILM